MQVITHVSVQPEFMTAAAADLESVGLALEEAQRAAASSLLTMAPAAADEVSVGIAQLFSQHARDYQAAAKAAAAFQENFVQNLVASTDLYTYIENAMASLLRALDDELIYYTNAATAFADIIVSYPFQVY